MRIPEPVLNEDFYMVKLIGGDVTLPAPRTRFEELLYIYAGGTIERPTPKTVEERFLDYITGGESELPTPKTRLQSYMYNVANPLNKIPVVPPKTRFECYWFVMATANYWESVQRIVRNGTANKIFPVGTKMYCHRGNDILEWDVIGIDHDTPADPQFTHSLTLQLHDCFPTRMQFDAREAFYYAETEMPAGTYNVTIGAHTWLPAEVGKTYQFTTTQEVPAGGQLVFIQPHYQTLVNARVNTFASATAENAIETLTMTEGSDGTPLGTIDNTVQAHINSIQRSLAGSNNYKESAIRQWLESNAVAGSVWVPQTNFDRPPDWTATTAGFLNGIDADFLAAIGKTRIVVARNTVTDGGGYDEMDDYFFLPSRSEVYGGVEVNGVNEGEPYPCYTNHSDLPAPSMLADSNRIKDRNGVPSSWWLRTPDAPTSGYARCVYETGVIGYDQARLTSLAIAPACNII